LAFFESEWNEIKYIKEVKTLLKQVFRQREGHVCLEYDCIWDMQEQSIPTKKPTSSTLSENTDTMNEQQNSLN